MIARIKNLKLGYKIGFSFAILIVLLAVPGIFTALKMNTVVKKSTTLSQESMPEIEFANDIEYYALLIMHEMGGYWLVKDRKYLNGGIQYLEIINDFIKKAKLLSEKYPSNVKFAERIKKINEQIINYGKKINELEQTDYAFNNDRDIMDSAINNFIKIFYEFLNKQNASFEEEINSSGEKSMLSESFKKITACQDIINLINVSKITNFTSQSKQALKTFKNKLENFDKINNILQKILENTKDDAGRNAIGEMKKLSKQYKEAALDLLLRWEKINLVSKEKTTLEITDMAKGITETEIKTATEATQASTKSLYLLSRAIIIGIFVIVILGVIFGIFNTYIITSPIKKMVHFIDSFGKGDLSNTVDIKTTDEIGNMAAAMNNSVANLKQMFAELSETAYNLSNASEELSASATQMASLAEEVNAQSETVAAASEQVNTSVSTVASASKQSSISVSDIARMNEKMSLAFNEVAKSAKKTYENSKEVAVSADDMSDGISQISSAIEEMTISLNEVSKNTIKASKISNNANSKTSEINTKMEVLVKASKQIGKFVGVIKNIADKTDMLALNATIEAAGAGEAGKGFAVVAGEVKELARQSAEAAEEIAAQIEHIQGSTNEALSSITVVGNIINEIADINGNIASSVEEQTSTAGEISKTVAKNAKTIKDVAFAVNESVKIVADISKSMEETTKSSNEVTKHIKDLANGINDVAVSTAESAKGVENISSNIQGIKIATKDNSKSALQTKDSSIELSKMASRLSNIIGRFKID